MIKAVIFDLAEVVITGIHGVEYILEPLLKVKANEIYTKLKGKKFDEFLNGKIDEEEYCNKIISKNHWKIDTLTLKNAFRQNFKEIPGTREIIIELKKKGLKLGLLSGHTKEWVDFLKRKFDFEKYFDCLVYSYQTGYNKPDKRSYKDIVEKIQVKPEQCIYIDDKEKFLEPAERMGMKIILFKSAEQLKKELASFSINID